jgi:hypothetical protein
MAMHVSHQMNLRIKRDFFAALGAFSAFVSQSGTADQLPVVLEDQRIEVGRWLLGTMDSSLQSIDDPSYFDVSLRHCEVVVDGGQIPLEYLLVLQSISTAPTPYRVRVTQLQVDLNVEAVTTTNFQLADGIDVAGFCDRPLSERRLSKSDLVVNRCTTYLRKDGERYIGGTVSEGCPSSINGAVRVTSEVELGPNSLSSWDRGWKADGSQAWGAVRGPYQFMRTDPERQDPLLAQLAAFFSGRLSNAEQVAADPVNFSAVEYQFCPVAGRGFDGPETRLMLARQTITVPGRTIERNRIYRFERTADPLPDEEDRPVLGAFSITTSPFDESRINPQLCDQPLERRLDIAVDAIAWDLSCVLEFRYDAGNRVYTGGTGPAGCASSFQGAVRLDIAESIGDGLISPWERWFDADGRQVAGSKVGPYVYKRTWSE